MFFYVSPREQKQNKRRGTEISRKYRDNGSGSALRYLADFPIHVEESEGRRKVTKENGGGGVERGAERNKEKF
jgi:hypothetical protein